MNHASLPEGVENGQSTHLAWTYLRVAFFLYKLGFHPCPGNRKGNGRVHHAVCLTLPTEISYNARLWRFQPRRVSLSLRRCSLTRSGRGGGGEESLETPCFFPHLFSFFFKYFPTSIKNETPPILRTSHVLRFTATRRSFPIQHTRSSVAVTSSSQ